MISIAVLIFMITYVQGELLPLELTTTAGCYYHGSYYPVGSFNPTPCEYCQCTTSGQAMCAIADCVMTPCVDPIHEKDKCCPTCPNGHNCKAPDGHIIKVGDTYHMDHYTTCHCDSHQWGSNLAVCAHRHPPHHDG
ncbi:von Willebrand factor C domain-containing protein 2-like [Saccostrea cucullata]|uniref:von Willebrand factor C domain-containing protein 2-like n=1 Tax=Saccostrea cuccullata TaxID=36930 RepID=UPI002ED0782E